METDNKNNQEMNPNMNNENMAAKLKEAFKETQMAVKKVLDNEIKCITGHAGLICLGETEDERFGISHDGESYVEVYSIIADDDEGALLLTEHGPVRFGDISTDETVELHDTVFDRLIPRTVAEKFGEAFGGHFSLN